MVVKIQNKGKSSPVLPDVKHQKIQIIIITLIKL